jgi:hypothetical protein
VTPDTGAQPGEMSPVDGSGPRELLRYRSAQGRWEVAAMILGSCLAGVDSTVVAVAPPAIGPNLKPSTGSASASPSDYSPTTPAITSFETDRR